MFGLGFLMNNLMSLNYSTPIIKALYTIPSAAATLSDDSGYFIVCVFGCSSYT